MEKETGIRVQRLSEDARIATKWSKLAAGHDLYTSEDINILANNRALVKIGLAIAVPEGTYGRIAPRSGLATKGISVDAGVFFIFFYFFLFFYVIYSLLRYKKSHGALGMAKTKPKSQNELTKETSGAYLFSWGP